MGVLAASDFSGGRHGWAGWRLLGGVRLTAACTGGQLGLAFVSSRGRAFDLDSVALTDRPVVSAQTDRACNRPRLSQKKSKPSKPAPAEPAPAPPSLPSQVQPRSFLNPFPDGSIWNTALPASPAVDSESSAKIAYWLTQIRNPLLGLRAYQTAIAIATPESPAYTISCTIYACPNMNQFGPVPIPAGAQADPSSDGQLAVWDPATGREWDFWVSQCPLRCALTGSGGSFSTDTLTPTVPYGGNAAHIPLLAGIVHPEEIKAGHISHPLVFSSPNVGKGHVCPAAHDDGDNLDARALREGTLLQLDPSVDVDALAIPAWQKTLARAMQQYGMYLVDGSGTLEIGGENPINRGDLWAEVGLMGDAAFFSPTFPWGRMRVLEPRSPWCG
jgi:hypothetical protein